MLYLLKEGRIRTKPSTTSRDTISLQKEQAVTNWMTANLELLAEFQFFSYSYSAVVLTNNLLYNHLFNYLPSSRRQRSSGCSRGVSGA